MDRESMFQVLREAETELQQRGIKSLAVFGSYARGDATSDSDLDLLVTLSQPVGLFEFVRLKLFLEEITQCRVDLVTPDAIRPEMKENILKEAIDVR